MLYNEKREFFCQKNPEVEGKTRIGTEAQVAARTECKGYDVAESDRLERSLRALAHLQPHKGDRRFQVEVNGGACCGYTEFIERVVKPLTCSAVFGEEMPGGWIYYRLCKRNNACL